MFSIADKYWMAMQKGFLKPVLGKTLRLVIDSDANAKALYQLAEMKDLNKDLEDQGPFILLYPDASQVMNVPGTDTPFVLKERQKSGKHIGGDHIFSLRKNT